MIQKRAKLIWLFLCAFPYREIGNNKYEISNCKKGVGL
ncbi:hypothetical protein bthur0004_66070 [Bacillus thuringiensis serovar sotto str. T04001]|nr:hypothetical protein bthur0004_66070 [Bacillus thuringiensis serovar sotto str. T04001]